jgi:hypothetical protein
MTQREPSAAAALFPHLKSGAPDVVERRREPSSIADAMFSHLKPPPPKPPNPYRESLLRNLRELNASLRLQKEGRR